MAPLLEFLLALFLFFAYASKLNEKFKGVHWPLAVSEMCKQKPSDLIMQCEGSSGWLKQTSLCCPVRNLSMLPLLQKVSEYSKLCSTLRCSFLSAVTKHGFVKAQNVHPIPGKWLRASIRPSLTAGGSLLPALQWGNRHVDKGQIYQAVIQFLGRVTPADKLSCSGKGQLRPVHAHTGAQWLLELQESAGHWMSLQPQISLQREQLPCSTNTSKNPADFANLDSLLVP